MTEMTESLPNAELIATALEVASAGRPRVGRCFCARPACSHGLVSGRCDETDRWTEAVSWKQGSGAGAKGRVAEA